MIFFENKIMNEYKFVGEDGSLGLRKGKKYLVILKLQYNSKTILAEMYERLFFGLLLEKGSCPYGSMQAFERNWHKI